MVLDVFCNRDNIGDILCRAYIYEFQRNGRNVIRAPHINFCGYSKQDLTPIATAAAVGPGTRAIGQTLRDINTRVAAAPGVKFSATHRTPDGNLEIHVELYKPVAQWTDGAQYYPLSADGTIVKSPSDARTPNTVVFRGTIPDNISEITNAAHNIVSELDYADGTCIQRAA